MAGLITLVMGQELAKLGRLGSKEEKKKIKPLNTKRSRRAERARLGPWRIPGTGEPSGLPSMGSHRVGHD